MRRERKRRTIMTRRIVKTRGQVIAEKRRKEIMTLEEADEGTRAWWEKGAREVLIRGINRHEGIEEEG
ncbi:MAG: hypothetical protein DRO36_06890 [Candidatus Hecatellales archaeon]|nr:MAG: hypothetical protein DRO36_06890 [Candidatus Hecatellales archaeon]